MDLRANPLSPIAPGLEHHANAIDNLLHADFNRVANRWLMLPLILLVGIGFGAAINAIRSQLLSGVVAILSIAAVLAAGYAALALGGWIVPAFTALRRDRADLRRPHRSQIHRGAASDRAPARDFRTLRVAADPRAHPRAPGESPPRRREARADDPLLRHPRLHVDLRGRVAGRSGGNVERVSDAEWWTFCWRTAERSTNSSATR